MQYGYTYLWMLLIYGFLGWCGEVLVTAVKTKRFVNRGLLNGPICPLYGFVMISLYGFTVPLAGVTPIVKILLYVLMAGLFGTALEFVTGAILNRLYRKKWWDYAGHRYHLGGYVCLEGFLLWAVIGTVSLLVVQPLAEQLILLVTGVVIGRFTVGLYLFLLLLLILLIDFVVTVLELTHIARKRKAAAELETLLGPISDVSGEELYQKVTERKEGKPELQNKLAKYKAVITSHNAVHNRLLTAFPSLQKETVLPKIKTLQALYRKLKEHGELK